MSARKSTKPEPAPLVGAGLGRVALTAFHGPKAGGESAWGQLVENEHDTAAAWCAVGQAVIAATIARKD